jgi:hypothetical protein
MKAKIPKKEEPAPQKAPSRAVKADVAPHSWLVSKWTECAPHVAPNTTASAKHMVRCHQDELVAAGALTRLGRDLVILGGPYSAWLAKRKDRVAGYELKMNAKRANGAEHVEAPQ